MWWYCRIVVVLLFIVIIDVVVEINATLDINVSKYDGSRSSKLDFRQKRDRFYIFKGKRVKDSTLHAVFPKSCDMKTTPGKCLGDTFTNGKSDRLFVKVNNGGTTVTQPQQQELPTERSKTTQSLTKNVGVPIRMTYSPTNRQPTMKKLVERKTKPWKNPRTTIHKPTKLSTSKSNGEKISRNQSEKKTRITKAIEPIPPQKSTSVISGTTKFTTIDQIRRLLLQESLVARINPPQFDVKRFREELTAYHNVYRRKHGSPSLIYDTTIERAAQNWANVLGNKRDCLVHENPRRYGENLFYFGAKQFPNPTTMAHMVTYSFYMEGMGYNYNKFYPMSYYKTGHFTQLIWKESRRMGVGVSIVHHNGSKKGPCQPSTPLYLIYVVVKYDPAGNFQTYQSYMSNVKSPIT